MPRSSPSVTLQTNSRPSFALLLRAAIGLPALAGLASCNTAHERLSVEANGPITVYDARDAAQWPVDEYGIGPLRANVPLSVSTAQLHGDIRVPEGEEASACSYADWSDAPVGVYVMLEQGVVARIEVDSASVATSAGARVGDTEARIDSLYAGRVVRQVHKYTDGRYLVVRASHGARGATPGPAAAESPDGFALIFETDGRRVTRYRAGRYPEVGYTGDCFEIQVAGGG